jgi:hypothetical protein
MSEVPNILKAQKAREAAKKVRDEYRGRDEEAPKAIIEEAKREALERLEREWADKVVGREGKEPEPEPAAAPAKRVVWYESRNPEPTQFDVAGIGSVRDFASGRILWEVTPDDVERFEKHFHFTNGRIRRKE